MCRSRVYVACTLERLSEMLAHLRRSSSQAKLLSQSELIDTKNRIHAERTRAKKFQENIQELEKSVHAHKETKAHDMSELRKGDKVKILINDAHGIVISVSQDKKKYLVHAGVLTLMLWRHEIHAIKENAADNKKSHLHSHTVDAENLSLAQSLDVRGCTSAEATEKLEAYIDTALLKKKKMFSVIHGKGTGVLMREIHRMVKKHPLVLHSEYADESDGGMGKTYVYLK